MKHEDIWRGIDRLAEARGLSVSGMARRAGLDPTTFNRSKRIGGDGKRRWPTTESLAKILRATDATLGDFVAMMHDGSNAVTYTIPAAETSEAALPEMFDEDGFPMGPSWGKIEFPAVNDPDVFGLFVEGDGFEPVYRDGDVLIVSPHASVRRGDRVLARQRGAGLIIRRLVRQTAHRVELSPVAMGEVETHMAQDVLWMSRIVWAQQ
ncbi:helix-turn-helix transcriptional regulator [Marivibrio halodurans]|uniref:Helix-turn-helix transcriptional regulator n=1 Tax=Marivibrio halodurans TaxID=2039722 RepID=A0A8J7V3W9_9PROT|nr:helix-turn-helix transcriptional regulator [Marivibrio halodurans]MBP5858462.1 helix-turn-helix transcriptional regulator [Marivibrio halodurans]